MQTKKNQTILFRILALLLICCLLPLSPVLASDPSDTPSAESSSELSGEDPSEEPTRSQPQCAETGEHMYESFTFAENSVHTAYCLYCGESFTLPCEYGETPEYVVNDDRTHSVFCLLCGGEKREGIHRRLRRGRRPRPPRRSVSSGTLTKTGVFPRQTRV